MTQDDALSVLAVPVPLGVALGLVLSAPERPFGHGSAHQGDFERMKPGLPG